MPGNTKVDAKASPTKSLKEFKSLLTAALGEKENVSSNLQSKSPQKRPDTPPSQDEGEPSKKSFKKKLKTTSTKESELRPAENAGNEKKNYVCTMCPKEWRDVEGNINSKMIHWHLLPVHFKSEFDMEIKAVFCENMCSFCGTEVSNRSKKASHLYSKHNTFKEEVKKVAKAITSGNKTVETSKDKSEKKTGNDENLKDEEAPIGKDEDDRSWEKEAELIQASLMMLQDISDSEEENDA